MKQLSKKEIFVLKAVENTRTAKGKIKQLYNIILMIKITKIIFLKLKFKTIK